MYRRPGRGGCPQERSDAEGKSDEHVISTVAASTFPVVTYPGTYRVGALIYRT